MNKSTHIWDTPSAYLTAQTPDHPVHFFAPEKLHAQAQRFCRGFNGLVSFAVKANPDPVVISNLLAAGITAFDVASPAEIALVQSLGVNAALHYNNPVRSKAEIDFAHKAGVKSYSVDTVGELAKINAIIPAKDVEISVRFKLPITGAAYDFGDKFGAIPTKAIELLIQAKTMGYKTSLTFHPGTQCENPKAWKGYIQEAARIAKAANIPLYRLNVGGGFPCQIDGPAPDLEAFFTLISETARNAFGADCPPLVCEPGRALVAESFVHATRVKSINDKSDVYLNDGIYGGLSEFPTLQSNRQFTIIPPDHALRTGKINPATVFGPTCDSLDVLPRPLPLPADLCEGDYIVFKSMGAYVHGVTTNFNGYGQIKTVMVLTF
ncbi:MAG: type III PLP-dependent enzyme [Paracoccaceae bacterium]